MWVGRGWRVEVRVSGCGGSDVQAAVLETFNDQLSCNAEIDSLEKFIEVTAADIEKLKDGEGEKS